MPSQLIVIAALCFGFSTGETKQAALEPTTHSISIAQDTSDETKGSYPSWFEASDFVTTAKALEEAIELMAQAKLWIDRKDYPRLASADERIHLLLSMCEFDATKRYKFYIRSLEHKKSLKPNDIMSMAQLETYQKNFFINRRPKKQGN